MKLNKEHKQKAEYIWQGIKTGKAKSHHYKVEMIKFYNELNNTIRTTIRNREITTIIDSMPRG